MSSTIISNTPPFGAMTNAMIANLYAVEAAMTRLENAVATAANGYTGVAGTEYEGNGTNFGVSASATPGANGAAYAYAIGVLSASWATWWAANIPSIEQLDNGVTSV